MIGYWLIKHDFEPAPMLLGYVLGPLMEENLRRAMLIARGDATIFVTRPISGGAARRRAVPAHPCGAADDPQAPGRGVRRVAGRQAAGTDLNSSRVRLRDVPHRRTLVSAPGYTSIGRRGRHSPPPRR